MNMKLKFLYNDIMCRYASFQHSITHTEQQPPSITVVTFPRPHSSINGWTIVADIFSYYNNHATNERLMKDVIR